jgi:branched-chain amino acid aminotransferase
VSKEKYAEKFQPPLAEMLGSNYNSYVYIDGKFVRGEEAKISVFDHCVLYGDAVFEGIRAYGGKTFKLDEHLDRLFDSAKALSIPVPLTKDEFKEVVRTLLELNGLLDAHIRPQVTRGAGRVGIDPRRAARPSVFVIAAPMAPLLGEKPVRMITSSIRRKPPDCTDSKIKSVNYLESVLARLQANAAAVDDAILLDHHGFVAEATGENVFVVKRGCILTPDTTCALAGVTRATVIELAAKLGYPVVVRNITLQELYSADEVFLTGTGAEVVPVGEVDGRVIGDGKAGATTSQIRQAYQELHG